MNNTTSETYAAIRKSFGTDPGIHFLPDTECDITMKTIDETDLFTVIKFTSRVARFSIFEKPDTAGHYKMMTALRDALNTFLDSHEPSVEELEAVDV